MELSPYMEDYLKQYNVLVDAMKKIMDECGSIYPAVENLEKGIKEALEAIKMQAIIDLGVDTLLTEKALATEIKHYYLLNKDFKKWREEKDVR